MKNQITDFILLHIPHIISGFAYSVLEYWIGKTKKTNANSLLELIQKNLWKN